MQNLGAEFMRLVLLTLITLASGMAAFASPKVTLAEALPQLLSTNFQRFDSASYTLYTDAPSDEAAEAILRMDKIADEYRTRLGGLFEVNIRQRMPLVLFSRTEDYRRFGFDPDSAGVFTGDALFVSIKRDGAGGISERTWRVMQHEGFHQFASAVIRRSLPPWLNEGLASYFEEAIFTGDGMVSGIAPLKRAQQVATGIRDGGFASTSSMMTMSQESWNAKLEGANYDQAWSMVHFLANAEDGKYRGPFLRFLQALARGTSKERAWAETFGNGKGFEAKWREYWVKMPHNASLPLEARATVAGLTSFMGRAHARGMVFEDFANFIACDAQSLKADPTEWLPPGLYTRMTLLVGSLQQRGCTFSIVSSAGVPQLLCALPEGKTILGSFALNSARRTQVTTELVER